MAIDTTKVTAVVTAADARYVKKEAGKGLSTEDFTTAEKTKLAGLSNTTVDSSFVADSTNPVQSQVIQDALDLKADAADLATVATTGSYDDLLDAPTIDELGGIVDVEKQTTAETGYAATYVVKQNGSQVGSKINIPKDFLVKSATLETVATANSPQQGFAVGDKYLDFVVNTVDDDETAQHIYINVKDLIDTYTADESTITLSNGQFAVKAGGIGITQLSSSVQTSLGYADAFNSSAAAGITSTDISNWNAKSELTTGDVESTVEAYLTALATALGQ